MDLFIKVNENNVPQNHPCLKNNLKQAFPSLDWDSSVPNGWMKFERIPCPVVGVYQKYDTPEITYEIIDGIVKDVWHIVDMTEDEKKARQDKVKTKWAARDPAGPASWTFDETTCSYKAPVDLPSDSSSASNPSGVHYDWDEETTSWKEVT
tara:strand:+ start:968 stop:1420 length:453 start_codon:yes stop_codon:yes gene_type:complete